MGRFESLTSLALGRGPYEEEVIETSLDGTRPPGQRYTSNGRPRNPETRRREREHVRAANEVMQVTGIVEDSIAARVKQKEALHMKNYETLMGLRLMEGGRAALVAGVWGVLGLRRRVLLYQPYSQLSILQIIRQERERTSIGHMIFAGMPTVFAYHLSDWAAFFLETIVEAILDEDDTLSKRQLQIRNTLAWLIELTGAYVTLHLRLFATLQQLNLMPSAKLLPSVKSFIPFTQTSPIARTTPLGFNYTSVIGVGTSLLRSAAPFVIIIAHGKLKYFISRTVYRPIYKSLPRPTGESMFSGLAVTPPQTEYDAPDRTGAEERRRTEDEMTLQALEELPSTRQREIPTQSPETVTESMATADGNNAREGSDDEEGDVQPTIISFDVEAAESVEPSLGTWSAELRNTNEVKPTTEAYYRVTGLTLLPTIMATEGLREVVAGLVVMPIEAIMVRLVGRAYRQAAGHAVDDMWEVAPILRTLSFQNLLPAVGMQVVLTGVVWAGFTFTTHVWSTRKRAQLEAEAKKREVFSRFR